MPVLLVLPQHTAFPKPAHTSYSRLLILFIMNLSSSCTSSSPTLSLWQWCMRPSWDLPQSASQQLHYLCLSLEPGKVSITLHHLSPMKNTDNSKRKEVNVSHPRVREFVNILSLTETETIALGNKNDRLYQTRACLCEDSVQDSDGKTVVLNSDFGLV